MHDPYGDPTDISGVRDDAPMETKSTTGPRHVAQPPTAQRSGWGLWADVCVSTAAANLSFDHLQRSLGACTCSYGKLDVFR